MLLGEDDFATVIGYPRGKHQLHQAWLHGSGVVWGYSVRNAGLWELKVGPGLAIDGIGRELLLTAHRTLDLRELRDKAIKDGTLEKAGDDCQTVTINACVVAEFEGCRTAPVPTLADPCDVNRTHDDYSRVIEQARINARLGLCPQRPTGRYHRVRVLLGLDDVGDPDEPGKQALRVRDAVMKATDRAQELEHQLWEMACWDSADLHPTLEDEHSYGWFRNEEEDAAVVLAEIDITLHSRDNCWEFDDAPKVRPCVRTTLLPTDVITSLTAGLAPALLGSPEAEQHGPQVYADQLRLEDERQKLIIPVTASLVPGTVPGAVEVTTLARNGSDSWVVEDIHGTSYDTAEQAIVVRLAYSLNERPAAALVRIRVRGTGGKPVMGEQPLLPLAGVAGRTPGAAQDGHDAVWTLTNDLGRDPANESESTAQEVTQ
jgi:hypothetical protein